MTFVDNLIRKRTELMGIAILMVLLYHLFCWQKYHVVLALFKYGYLGVDIFLLVSALGNCYSYNKHTLATFYGRRLKKILPLYWCSVLAIALLEVVWPTSGYDALTLFAQLTTLSYWGLGTQISEWFVAAILVLYLTFPLSYGLTSRFPIPALLLGCLIPILCQYLGIVDAWHECLISRIPIFIFGIICYQYHEGKSVSTKQFYCACLILSLVFVFSCVYSISDFLTSACICPLIVFIAIEGLFFLRNVHVEKVLRWFGQNSFVIYTSNLLVGWCSVYCYSHWQEYMHTYTYIPIYCTLQCVLGFAFYKASKIFDRIFA